MVCHLRKAKDELVYISLSEIERVEKCQTYHALSSEFNHPFKAVLIYNRQERESASFSLEICALL